jgi:hypothetical protein
VVLLETCRIGDLDYNQMGQLACQTAIIYLIIRGESSVKRCWLLMLLLFWLTSSNVASATMVLQSYNAADHDRFYVGTDKSFIGDPYDWSGVGRSSYWVTMVSSDYFLTANHYHPSVGETLYFYWSNDPSGGQETATVASGVQIGESDLWLGRLSTSVSSQVEIYPILALPENSAYDNLTLYTFGLSSTSPTQENVRLGRNEIDPGSYAFYNDAATGLAYTFTYDSPGLGADESYLQPGDSGGPSFSIIDGLPAMVGIHWFIWTDDEDPNIYGSADTFIPHYIDDINAAMVGQQLMLIPEPSILVMVIGLMPTWLFWRLGARSRHLSYPVTGSRNDARKRTSHTGV